MDLRRQAHPEAATSTAGSPAGPRAGTVPMGIVQATPPPGWAGHSMWAWYLRSRSPALSLVPPDP